MVGLPRKVFLLIIPFARRFLRRCFLIPSVGWSNSERVSLALRLAPEGVSYYSLAYLKRPDFLLCFLLGWSNGECVSLALRLTSEGVLI